MSKPISISKLVLLLVLFGLTAPCHSGTGTPDEVFKAAHEAYRKQGAKGFLPSLTKDSQKIMTGGMVTNFYTFRAFVLSRKEPNPEAVKLLEELAKRHGFDDAKVKPLATKMPKTAEEAITNLKALSDLVKDGPAFVEDVVTTLNRFEGPFPPLTLSPPGAVLKDLKIRGETAAGTMHYRYFGMDRSEPIHFRQEGGYWKVDLLPPIHANFSDKK